MDFLITDYNTGKQSSMNTVVLEDCIMQKDKKTTAGSKILDNFISPLDATVISRLENAGKTILGKAKMDEFGIGRVSSDRPDVLSGVIEAVASGFAEAGLGNDFSGKLRRQAPEHGISYIHPTYGTVSRYGLIPMISSMDQIGIACKTIEQGFTYLSRIAGNDSKDGAMFSEADYSYTATSSPVRIGIPDNVMNFAAEHAEPALDFAGKFETVHINLEYFDVYRQVMYILGCAEISNNISRYDGIKFGYRTENYQTLNDLYLNTRTEGFNSDTKLSAIMGSMVLSQDYYHPLYEKAMKIRRLIKESLPFDKCDVIILPVKNNGDPYEQSALYSLSALAGLPSVTFPYQSGGVQLIANIKNENALLTAYQTI